MKKRSCIFAICFLLFWTLFVLYPRPIDLGRSVYRLFHHPIGPKEVGILEITQEVSGETPSEIERIILSEIPYAYDWEVYGMPWYFPTTEEVLTSGRGDCKSRFIVAASAFENLEIPYSLYLSTSHVWISYEGKEESDFENSRIVLLSADGDGAILKRPPKVEWGRTKNSFVEAFWRKMPPERKALFCLGPYLSFSIVVMATIFSNRGKFYTQDL